MTQQVAIQADRSIKRREKGALGLGESRSKLSVVLKDERRERLVWERGGFLYFTRGLLTAVIRVHLDSLPSTLGKTSALPTPLGYHPQRYSQFHHLCLLAAVLTTPA